MNREFGLDCSGENLEGAELEGGAWQMEVFGHIESHSQD